MTARAQSPQDGSQKPPAVPRRPAPGAARGARLRRLPLPVLLGLLLVGGLCALLALNTASAAQELKQRSLTESNAALSDQAQQLMRDLAAKQAPAALAAAAAAQGLVPNPNPAFLRLNADGSVTVLGSPTPASVAPPPMTPKPTATARPAASPTATAKPTATSTASSAASSAASSTTATPAASSTTRPGAGTPAASSARPSSPVVTVTVTRPAPPATPSTRPSPTKSTAPGGH